MLHPGSHLHEIQGHPCFPYLLSAAAFLHHKEHSWLQYWKKYRQESLLHLFLYFFFYATNELDSVIFPITASSHLGLKSNVPIAVKACLATYYTVFQFYNLEKCLYSPTTFHSLIIYFCYNPPIFFTQLLYKYNCSPSLLTISILHIYRLIIQKNNYKII